MVLIGCLIAFCRVSTVQKKVGMSITGHSDVDMESASAFSPSEPSVDGVFVSKHNQSAEIYQVKTLRFFAELHFLMFEKNIFRFSKKTSTHYSQAERHNLSNQQ